MFVLAVSVHCAIGVCVVLNYETVEKDVMQLASDRKVLLFQTTGARTKVRSIQPPLPAMHAIRVLAHPITP